MRPMISASVDTTSKYQKGLAPIRPTLFMSPAPAKHKNDGQEDDGGDQYL